MIILLPPIASKFQCFQQFVEAIRKYRALTGCAPLTKTEPEAAIAPNEEIKPNKPAKVACFQLR
jgi:hypothetical protein